MRAWAVVAPQQPLQEVEWPTPEPTGKQVLLEVTHAGVCHSDIHIWEGSTTSAAAA
jgi:alcohol dehydrogenase/propanol-preferring alcohol dehydrogenase